MSNEKYSYTDVTLSEIPLKDKHYKVASNIQVGNSAPLYIGTNKPVNELSLGDEGKYWATPSIEYALEYARSPMGISTISVSENGYSTDFNSKDFTNGYVYKVQYPEVFTDEYGFLEYTSMDNKAKHLELVGRVSELVNDINAERAQIKNAQDVTLDVETALNRLPALDKKQFQVLADNSKGGYRQRVEVIVYNKDGEVLIGNNPRGGYLEIPGGGIDPGETIIEAAARELKEETGKIGRNFKILNWKPLQLNIPFSNKEGKYDGCLTYWVGCRITGGQKPKILGADNDVMKRIKFVTTTNAAKKFASDDSEWAPLHAERANQIIKNLFHFITYPEKRASEDFIEVLKGTFDEYLARSGKFKTNIVDSRVRIEKKADFIELAIDPLAEAAMLLDSSTPDQEEVWKELPEAERRDNQGKPVIMVTEQEGQLDVDQADTLIEAMQKLAASTVMNYPVSGPRIKEAALEGSAGQVLVNSYLPSELRDMNRVMNKKNLKKLMQNVADKYAPYYADISHNIKRLGDREAVFSSKHLAYDDLKPPINVDKYLQKAEQLYRKKRKKLGHKFAMVDAYGEMKQKMNEDTLREGLKNNNTLAIMAQSGARGNPAQVTDTITGVALVADYKNDPIPVTIDKSYGQGLTPEQYFAASYGTRRGMISTKLAVPQAGYMSKMFSWTMNDVVVTETDCKTNNGTPYPTEDNGNLGRFLATGTKQYSKNTQLTNTVLSDLVSKGVKTIVVRSPMTCEADSGVCKLCYGKSELGALPPKEYNAGINTAAAMSEPISQGMLSEKHTGGAIKKRIGGYPLIKRLITIPKTFPDKASLATSHGRVDEIRKAPWGGWEITVNGEKHRSGKDQTPIVKENDVVEKGDILTDGIVNPSEYVQYNGLGEGRRKLSEQLRDAFDEMGAGLDRVHFEMAARSLVNFGRVEGKENIGMHLPGDTATFSTLQRRAKVTGAKPVKLTKGMSLPYGKFLAKPALHYTMGTEVTRKVAADLLANGFDQILITERPPQVTPVMVRIEDTKIVDPDWMARLSSQGLKRSLVKSVQKGLSSDIASNNYVHPYVYGRSFGETDKAY